MGFSRLGDFLSGHDNDRAPPFKGAPDIADQDR